MNFKKTHKIFRKTMALAMVGMFMFSQFIVLGHYWAFHLEKEHHRSEKDKHHPDNCFICHTQSTIFLLSDFDFKIKERKESFYLKYEDFEAESIIKNIDNQNAGRAPPLDFG